MELSQHVSVGGHSTKHNLDNSYRATLDHVERGLSAENVVLRSSSLKKVYAELFDDAVKAYNDKQKRADRKIEDYYEKVRDDARGHKGVQNKEGKRLAYEQVVGIGNRETFHASNPENVELAKAIYGDYVTEFEARFPHLRVFEAVIHVDELEGGIHLHNAYVPWGEGYKKGMSRQQSLSKACENMGFSHMELDTRSKQLLEEVCLRHGVTRLDMGNTDHHTPTDQFKREQRALESIRLDIKKEKARHLEQMKVLAAEKSTLQRSVRKMEACKADLLEKTKNVALVRREAMQEASAARREVQALRTQIEGSISLLDDIEASTSEATASLAAKTEELAMVSDQVDTMTAIADSLRDDVLLYAEQARERKREAEKARGEASSLQDRVDSLKAEVASLERTKEALGTDVKALKKEKGTIQKAIDTLQQTFEDLCQMIARWMPEPLRQLARLWRDDDDDEINSWHNDMDVFAIKIIPELPSRLQEEAEWAIAASASSTYGQRNSRDEWDIDGR